MRNPESARPVLRVALLDRLWSALGGASYGCVVGVFAFPFLHSPGDPLLDGIFWGGIGGGLLGWVADRRTKATPA